jgi:methoxymalonate biosynthesis acyl carrier protein
MDQNEQLWRSKIRTYIEQNMNTFDEDVELRDDDHIVRLGYVSSIFAMRLLGFVEREFGVTVGDDDIKLENFASVNAIIALIDRLHAKS